jgi:DUF883 C-terminal glycine zipper region
MIKGSWGEVFSHPSLARGTRLRLEDRMADTSMTHKPTMNPAKVSGRQSRDVVQYVKDEPLTSLAIAAGVGFIVGGGARSRAGLALLAFIGRIALGEVAAGLLIGAVTGNGYRTRRNFQNRR